MSAKRLAPLEEFALARMGETHLPSVTLAAVEGQETVYARGFGVRDVERSLPATPRLKREGNFLMLKIENKLLSQTVPLVPVSLEPTQPRFFTLTLGRRLVVDFHVRPDRVELIYERYRMRRVGTL